MFNALPFGCHRSRIDLVRIGSAAEVDVVSADWQ